jgi:hypothetical protein
MRYLQLRELEQVAARRGFRLCPACSTLYEPCAAATLQWTAHGVAHILPVVYIWDGSWCCVRRWYLRGRFCDGVEPMPLHGRFCTWYATLDNGEFLSWLLQRYPGLSRKPLTEPVLNQLGIDLESEIAMWQLAGGCTA